jgi:hypothetical protein
LNLRGFVRTDEYCGPQRHTPRGRRHHGPADAGATGFAGRIPGSLNAVLGPSVSLQIGQSIGSFTDPQYAWSA